MVVGAVNSTENNVYWKEAFNKETTDEHFGDVMTAFLKMKEELGEKIARGDFEESFDIGANSYTNKEWGMLLKRFDKMETAIQEEVKEEIEQRKQEELSEEVLGKLIGNNNIPIAMRREPAKFPYEHLAKDGIINYKGVVFVCDENKNALLLGDCSNPKNCISVNLENGGRLIVNRENLNELADAISMFSPEDIRRILCAIADDKKIQATQKEIDDAVNGLGEKRENEEV